MSTKRKSTKHSKAKLRRSSRSKSTKPVTRTPPSFVPLHDCSTSCLCLRCEWTPTTMLEKSLTRRVRRPCKQVEQRAREGKGRRGLSSKLFITSAPKNFPRNCSLSGGWKQSFRGTRVRGEGGGERESFLKAERKLGRVASTLLVSCYNLQRAWRDPCSPPPIKMASTIPCNLSPSPRVRFRVPGLAAISIYIQSKLGWINLLEYLEEGERIVLNCFLW